MAENKGRWGFLGLIAIAAVALLVLLRGNADPAQPTPTDPPAATATLAYGGLPVVQAPVELFAQPDSGGQRVLQAIDGAQESIRLKIYLITHEAVIDALKRAAARGVDTRVQIEEAPFGGGESNRLAAEELQAAGVQLRNAPAAFVYSHEKSLVVDDRRAFVMTFNLTNSSFGRNREYGVILDDPALVEEVAAVFDADWESLEPDLAASRLTWSPVNSRANLAALIDSAQASLELEQTSMLDDGLIERLIAAAQRGVRVRLTTPAVYDPSEWEYEPLNRLFEAGVAIRFLDDPYVHAKVVLADGKVAFVGSQNFTSTSLDQNRELGILFDDAAAVNRLASYLLNDWNAAQPWSGPQPTATLPPAGIVDWQDAAGYLGQTITVAGDVIDTYDSGKVTFLNFDEDRTFTVVIFADDYASFPALPEDLYWRKRVQVTGQVKLYNEKPEIIVDSPEQIEVLADLLALSGEPTATLPANGVVDWQDAASYFGQRVTVEGDVVRSYNSGRAAFLNFAEDYEGVFSVVIFAADFELWPEPPDQFYLGQRIRVSGKVKEYQGAPEMVVESPEQVEIISPAQVELPPTPEPPPLVDWREAAGYEGQTVIVQGVVVDTYKSEKVIFLNFSANRNEFKAVIFERNWDKWLQPPDELYMGKTLRISGEVQLYEGAPEIIVDGPAQVQVVE